MTLSLIEKFGLSWILAGIGAGLLLVCVSGWMLFWRWYDRRMDEHHARAAELDRRWDRLVYPRPIHISPCMRDMKDTRR